ncbi:MAG: type IV secretory system conjugative DNA transfer family protein [Lachnospiraceae bacterium]|nr:type IV secretory system conjugative DNA transfer family protein [Lachnospiraceae bacterium]
MPWHFPLRLSVKELSGFMLLPVGEDTLPGTVPLHPKAALPPGWYREPRFKSDGRSFAAAMNGERLSISPKDALEHTIILGPTGSGKSTAMLNLILSDITAGRGVLVIDPKQDLVDDVLERIPAHRRKDVVVVDPASPEPVGFNPLSCAEGQDKELTADTVLSVLKEIFADSWGVRTQDILSAAILTLMEVDGASLMWLPGLLTNEKFRTSITKSVKDEIALKPFWLRFENLTPYQRQQMIEPVLNKLRQFLLRPKLRNCLG